MSQAVKESCELHCKRTSFHPRPFVPLLFSSCPPACERREFASAGLRAAAAPPSAAAPLAPASCPALYPGLPGVQEVALLLARFSCNNHSICDEELRPIGAGLYPLGALLNHSCRPNCMQGFGANGGIEFRCAEQRPPAFLHARALPRIDRDRSPDQSPV